MKSFAPIAIAVCLVCVSPASLIAAPVVAWFDRQDGPPTPELGWLLLRELQCAACHSDPAGGIAQQSRQAPRLERVAERLSLDYLRKFLARPAHVKPGTTMPALFAATDPSVAAEQVENLVHYLASLTPERARVQAAPIGGRHRGEQLYHRIGCVACHDRQQSDSPPLDGSVPLGELSAKYTLPTLADFLLDPLAVRPSGRMPAMGLSPKEALDLAAFLLPSVPEQQGIAYDYYEGSWNDLPDFDELQPVVSGVTDRIDISLRRRDGQFALRFQGRMEVDRGGRYTLHVASDDGSRVLVDGQLVVDNDGVHGATERSETLDLERGEHLVQVEYFELSGEESLRVEIQGPDLPRQPLAGLLLRSSGPPLPPLPTFDIDENRVEKGRRLFVELGCSACHAMPSAPSAAPRGLALAELSGQGGCLSAEARAGAPFFALDERQQAALRLGLSHLRQIPPASDSRATIIATMAAMNCYACHSRDGVGGVVRERDPYFETTQPEMGEEGRIPPALDGVGGKLTDVWIRQILHQGAKDRPYMQTRMPAFGASNVGHLAPHFQKLDVLPPLARLPLDPGPAKRAGWQMVGSRGFSCIKCHTFGRYQATGVQSIDMTIMHRRLRPEWFRRYVRNPQQFRPQTRMPAAWPAEGKSLLPDLLDGDSDRQIQAVWMFLEDGPRAKTPLGLVSENMELIPGYEALIYRNFIQGVGPRGIAVGYPEGLHLAFDAERLRLAMVWRGAFIDASLHWTGRGNGFQGPAGQDVQSLPDGVPLAHLEDPQAAWPDDSARDLPDNKFEGYWLVEDRRPVFRYQCGPIHVEDYPRPVVTQTQTYLSRQLTFSSDQSVDGWYFRAAVAPEIQRQADGSFQAGALRIAIQGANHPPALQVRAGPSGQQELLVPLVLDGQPMVLLQEIYW